MLNFASNIKNGNCIVIVRNTFFSILLFIIGQLPLSVALFSACATEQNVNWPIINNKIEKKVLRTISIVIVRNTFFSILLFIIGQLTFCSVAQAENNATDT
jgi:preprotein translocase subunit SecE